MNFIPETNLRLLTNVPLDNTYRDTILFDNLDSQYNYFNSKVIPSFSYSDFTYQRIDKKILVPLNAEKLYNVNYLMFQNKNFGNKWFYAFVKKIEYKNESTSAIDFEIDIFQTWWFSINLKECFVEREHVNDDTIGINTLPENIEHGTYITTSESNFTSEGLNLYLLVTEVVEGMESYFEPPDLVGGFPIPCYYAKFGSIERVTELKTIIDAFAKAGKADAVVCVFTAPSNFISTEKNVREIIHSLAPRRLSKSPKNNKLYTYPYCSLSVIALGQGIELQYEKFSDSPQLKLFGGFGANMQIVGIPINYEGQSLNIQNSISIKDFPICAWTTNYYQNWLAQNKASLSINTVRGVVSTVGGIASGALAGATAGGLVGGVGAVPGAIIGGISGGFSGASQIANSLAAVYQHEIIPDRMTGSANAGDILSVTNLVGFYSYCRSIKPEYIDIIDNYFSMFGYKVNQKKIPNIRGRLTWNYVKNLYTNLSGNAPVDVVSGIKSIFNNGITFWHSGEFVGDYSRDNRIR